MYGILRQNRQDDVLTGGHARGSCGSSPTNVTQTCSVQGAYNPNRGAERDMDNAACVLKWDANRRRTTPTCIGRQFANGVGHGRGNGTKSDHEQGHGAWAIGLALQSVSHHAATICPEHVYLSVKRKARWMEYVLDELSWFRVCSSRPYLRQTPMRVELVVWHLSTYLLYLLYIRKQQPLHHLATPPLARSFSFHSTFLTFLLCSLTRWLSAIPPRRSRVLPPSHTPSRTSRE